MKNSIFTFIKFSLLWLAFIAIPFIGAVEPVVSSTEQVDIYKEKPITYIQPAESSLYKQAFNKVIQLVSQNRNGHAYKVLQNLPASEIMDVLHTCIFTEALISWSFAEKRELVEQVIKFDSMGVYLKELKGLMWTLEQCQKLDYIDLSVIDELKNIQEYSVSYPLHPFRFPSPMPPGWTPKPTWQGLITIKVERHTQIPGNYALKIKEQIFDDQGQEYVGMSLRRDLPETIIPSSIGFRGAHIYVEDIYDQARGYPTQDACVQERSIKDTTIRAVERFALSAKLAQLDPTHSIAELANEIAMRYVAELEDKEDLYTDEEDKEDAYKVLGHLWNDSKLNYLQNIYLRFLCTRFIAFYRPTLSEKEIEEKINKAMIECKLIEKVPKERGIPKEYVMGRIQAKDDTAHFKVLMALMPGHYNTTSNIKVKCPGVNALILNSIKLSKKPTKDEKVNPLAYGITSPVFKALTAGNSVLVTELLSHGADSNTALYFDKETLSSMMNKYAISANLLAWACRSDQEEIVQALLDAGADVNAPCTLTGKLPIEYACENGNQNIIGMLRRYGADEKMYDQRKRKLKMHAQLPNLAKLQYDAETEKNEPILDFVQKISRWSTDAQVSAVLERYFDTTKSKLSKHIKNKIEEIKKDQQEKKDALKKSIRAELIISRLEKRPEKSECKFRMDG